MGTISLTVPGVKVIGSVVNVPIKIAASLVTLDFNLKAAAIMMPIDLQASYIMCPVDIQAQYMNLAIDIVAQTIGNIKMDIAAQTIGNIAVNIAASAITLNVNISSITGGVTFNIGTVSGTVNVNIAAQAADVTINIKAQTVGVSIQGEWQVGQGNQKQIWASGGPYTFGQYINISYAVPPNKTLYVYGASFSIQASSNVNADSPQIGYASVFSGATELIEFGGNGGQTIPFTSPIKIAGGITATLRVRNYANHGCLLGGSLLGYEV